MKTKIPIFPLNLVVFPGSKYPLHIFEERYKILIRKCLKENTGFGIVASFDKKISDVGVYVNITDILKKYENGESDIVVQGVERYLINRTSLSPNGYYEVEMEKYPDDKEKIDLNLVDELEKAFKEIIELANFKLEDAFWINLNSAKLKSYKIAEKAGLSYDQQQELLVLKKENKRLKYLLNYFRDILEKVDRAEVLKKIVLSDGYLN